MPSTSAYLVVGALAALATFLTTELVRRVAVRVGAVSEPDERRVHEHATPSLGGIAMFVGLGVALVAGWAIDDFDAMYDSPNEIVGLLVAAAVIVFVGIVDDVREISAPAKLAGMALAGSVLSFAGIALVVLRVPFLGVTLLSADWSALLTVVWVIVIANAVNIIDGLDGLAAGIVAIASATFFVYTLRLAEVDLLRPGNPGALFAVIALGMCAGFLPHNMHPARIFMGDCGAMLLGVMMAASTMAVGGRTDESFSGQAFFFFAPALIPIVILGVPLADMVVAILRRATRRVGVATADKNHLHHRLMRMGHGHRRTVLVLWAWTALLCVLVLYPTYSGRGDAFVPLGVAALALLLYTVLWPGLRRRGESARNGGRGVNSA